MSNGTVNTTGYTSVSPDDYGSYGFLIGQQFDDEFYPANVSNPFTPTYLTGAMLFVTKPGMPTGSILLSDVRFWADFIENPPPTPDGIDGPFARTVTSSIVLTGTNEAASAFSITDTAAEGIALEIDLVQRLTSDLAAVTSQLDQIYTITNTGTADVELVFHLVWDPDLFFDGENKASDDNVGIGTGVCGVYAHDGDPRWSVALGSGPMSTLPMTYYYAGKEDFVPGTGPAFAPISADIDMQWTWISKGIVEQWQNYVVGAGVLATGESDPALVGDATLGIEWRFALPAGEAETIHIRRYYGSTGVPCFVSANCGNGALDAGELCDGEDTADCVGATCSASACGDSYTNAAAGEACDTGGADSETCNAMTCAAPACGDGYANAAAGEMCDDAGDSAACNADCTPAACGDGYLNTMAAEECDDTSELCDPATCTVTFTLGGGCAGCGAGGGAPGTLLVWGMLVAVSVRRRRARAA